MIEPARIQILNARPIAPSGSYVLYWMQQSQRTRFNHALEYAIAQANALKLPLLVCFGLMDDYPDANQRHYGFMLQGLADVKEALKQRRIRFVVRRGSPPVVAAYYGRAAAIVVCDRGYLRHQKRWRDALADGAKCRVVQVESDVVVPVEITSTKAEFAARTIRPKILKHRDDYLKPLRAARPKRSSLQLKIAGNIDVSDPLAALKKLKVDRSVGVSNRFIGGEVEARRRLRAFVSKHASRYNTARNEPAAMATSFMSPYLHFGQISPIEIALAVRAAKIPKSDRDAYLEELIVRRELSMNFVHYTPNYDSYEALPQWARKTLEAHATDPRPTLYSRAELLAARTYDRWWNAAQMEMNRSGFMHNYMRMYWGKKILEWSSSPKRAYETVIHLNNRLFIDGRDAVGYANVLWIFGLHDRPWGRRPIFGQIRYMNAAGLERKFDMEKYERFVQSL